MKKSFQFCLSLVLFVGLTTGCVTRNKVSLQTGTLDFLKQQSVVNVTYSYDGLRIGTPSRSVSEEDHVAKKTAKQNEKTAGAGDQWRQEWVGNRTARFQPKFENLLNKQVGNDIFGQHPEAPYTLVLKTTYLEPGWNAGISARPALLNADVTFVATKNPANPLATLSLINMVGMDAMGYAYDEGWRMQESYAMAGKRLGAFIHKKIK